MTTITNEIRKDIDGTIERFEDMGEFDLLLVSRDCPYCHGAWEQPVLHIAIHKGSGSLSTTYICPRCSSYYYFVGDKIYQYIPEAQLLYIPNYVKKPSRMDTIKDYRSLYHRAKAFKWWEDVDLEVTDHIIEGKWTMPVEVAAQMAWKDDRGKAPGYSIGDEIMILAEDPDASNYDVPKLDTESFLLGLNFLKEKGLVK